jgi:hypothetical protein
VTRPPFDAGFAMSNSDRHLRELNHRVKNNFQIIVSLMNLKKRMLPRERREDIRFLEEHVMAMAVAYRLVYATGDMVEVGAADLVEETMSGLRQIAGLPGDLLTVDTTGLHGVVHLDQAIALGLYLAAVVPPYLARALAEHTPTTVHARSENGEVQLCVACGVGPALSLDFLNTRLVGAYVTQLKATALAPNSPTERGIRFPLG